MIKKLSILIGLIAMPVASTSVIAQGITSIDVASERQLMADLDDKNAIGSPYVDETFSPVRVEGMDNKIYVGRFNAHNGEMEINIGNKIIALDRNRGYTVVFTKDNKTYRGLNYRNSNGSIINGFLVLVKENGNMAVYKREVIDYIEAVPAATSYQTDKPAKYDRKSDEYYYTIGDRVQYLPTKKKDLIKAFPSKAKEVKSFIKNEKLNPKNEEDLVKIVSYVSSL